MSDAIAIATLTVIVMIMLALSNIDKNLAQIGRLLETLAKDDDQEP